MACVRVLRWLVVLSGLLAVLAVAPAGAAPIPPPGPAVPAASLPNDPGFAACESQDPVTGCTDDEEWDAFGPLTGACAGGAARPGGSLPCWARNATDPAGQSGSDLTGAWAQGNVGRDDILIGYIEGGVNYGSNDVKDALDNIYINRGELPRPQRADGTYYRRYDADGNGRFDLRDYEQDPRVNPACPAGTAPFVNHEEGVTWGCVPGGRHAYVNHVDVADTPTPYLSPEDLIAVFGHCRIRRGRTAGCPAQGRFDNDGNGYPNDVSGWNFDRNTNDPQTEEPGYDHAPSLLSEVAGVANNHWGSVGACRACRIVPIKQGAECLGRSDRWAEAILYATDLHVTAISSVVVSYTYSSFGRKALEYANDHGVLLALDSNDFDAMDHTDGMLYPHAIPGNGVIQDRDAPDTKWFRARSNITSYGTHNIFSGQQSTTSGATPWMASLLAMTQSAARNARDAHRIPDELTPDEVKQTLMDTASPITPQTQAPNVPNQWPGNPASRTDATHTNWSTQYGYGRVDVGRATALIDSGRVPPTAEIDRPGWFAYVDPARRHSLPIGGQLARSRWRPSGRPNRHGDVRWRLEWAIGANPADTDFHTISRGRDPERHGRLGTLNLRDIPRSAYEHAPTSTLPPDGPEQYTLTLRLRVRDRTTGLKAEDRRTIGIRHDPKLVRGFPRHLGGEISAAPTYADLEGRREQDLVYGTHDGDVHALRPDGTEVPGFPVHSEALADIDPRSPENLGAAAYGLRRFAGVRDPIAGVAVGDLLGDGRLDVVATSTNANVYAWDAQGRRLKGFPKSSARKYWSLPVPTPRTIGDGLSKFPGRGAFAPPVLADLEGTGHLDVLMSAYDGHVYAWRPSGRAVPGWPVKIALPPAVMARDHVDPAKYMHDPKLMYPVAVGDVLGTGHPQVFVSGFECDGNDSQTWLYGVWGNGNRHPGGAYLPNWPVSMPTLAMCEDESIDFVGEGTSPPAIATVDGTPRVISAGVTGPPQVINGDGSVARALSPGCGSADCGPLPPYRPGDPLAVELTDQGAVGDVLGNGTPQFVQSAMGAASFQQAGDEKGQAALIQTYEKAWTLDNGAVAPGFPRRQDGLPFYDAPLVADVGGPAPAREAIEANDSGWIHAYVPGGGEAPGFPKYTGEWPSFSGTLADPRMDGHLQMAWGTREGDLFAWRVGGAPARNDQWWHLHHDERNTGDYGLDTRRPATVAGLRARRGTDGRITLTWRAPGDDAMVGRAARYAAVALRRPATARRIARARPVTGLPAPAPARAGEQVVLTLPRRARFLALRAVDDAGNLGAARVIPLPGAR